MKKLLVILLLIMVSCGCAFGAKYKINQSGVIKNGGQIMAAPSNVVNQNYYNNYSAADYISNNIVNTENSGIVEIVMDYSGSMLNWIGVAQRSMTSIVSQIPANTRLGLRVFGHDGNYSNPYKGNVQEVKQIVKKKNGKFQVVTKESVLGSTRGACSATQQVSAIVSANAKNLIAGMNSVGIGGVTPLVYALDRAIYQDFANFDTTTPKKVVLITDGGENCGGDPCAFARQLMAKRSDVHIDVVLVSPTSNALACLASTTGGHFYTVNNLSDFSNTITNSIQAPPKEVPQNVQNQNVQQHYEFVKTEE